MKKKYKLRILSFLIIISATLISCHSTKNKHSFISDLFSQSRDYLTIWVHSDIQPRNKEEWVHYETAIKDINENVNNIDFAIVAGDIVNYSKTPYVYEWYLRTKKKSYIKYWYEIGGNHEAKDFKNYIKYIKMPLYYSVIIGNILILFMSDEIKSKPTEISDKTFKWWKNNIINNQDKIIITVTHACLKESKLIGTFLKKLTISDSKRFVEVLKKYNIDIWISGHTHIPNYISTKVRVARELNNTLFIDVSAIRKDFLTYIESRIFIFKKNSNQILIKSRNHEKAIYDEKLEVFHCLRQNFIWDSSSPKLSIPEDCKNYVKQQ